MDRPPKILWRRACPRRCRWARRSAWFRRWSVHSCLSPSHFELSPQNPIQQTKQSDCRPNEHDRVERENVDFRAEITFFRAEENVRSRATTIVALLHFRVGNQIGDFLVHINLFGSNVALRFSKVFRIKSIFSIEYPVDLFQVTVEIVG